MTDTRPDVRTLAAWMLIAWTLGALGCSTTPEMVTNPDYAGWAGFSPGSYVVFEGVEITGHIRRRIRLTEKLIVANDDRVILERTICCLDGPEINGPRSVRRIEPALIHPDDDPRTNPTARTTTLPPRQLTIAGKTLTCDGLEFNVHSTLESFFPTAQNLRIQAYTHDEIPGGLAQIDLSARTATHRFTITGQVVRFEVVQPPENTSWSRDSHNRQP